MQPGFKQRFWKTTRWFALLFAIMFAGRLLYGYVSPGGAGHNGYADDFFGSVANLRKNYASEKRYMKNDVANQADRAASQKYEKTATVKSKTAQYETDAGAIKSATKNFEGVVQYEQNTGNKGSRELHLLIGIAPQKFDSFYQQALAIGVIRSTEITKIDKTNEYRQLNAKKASLEKTLFSLNDLTSRSGQIGDYILLHDKILEIETHLQELGVELGNFDAENEFCTIKFSLYEGAAVQKISFLYRIKVAAEWAIKYYAVLVFSMLVLSASVFILLLIADRLKIIKAVTDELKP